MYEVEVNAPLVLLCVRDTFMGRGSVFFPRLTRDFHFLRSISLDLIELFLSWHVALAGSINSLTAVLSRLNEINVSISQILSDNFLRLYSDKSCGWEFTIFSCYFLSLNMDVWGDIRGGYF